MANDECKVGGMLAAHIEALDWISDWLREGNDCPACGGPAAHNDADHACPLGALARGVLAVGVRVRLTRRVRFYLRDASRYLPKGSTGTVVYHVSENGIRVAVGVTWDAFANSPFTETWEVVLNAVEVVP